MDGVEGFRAFLDDVMEDVERLRRGPGRPDTAQAITAADPEASDTAAQPLRRVHPPRAYFDALMADLGQVSGARSAGGRESPAAARVEPEYTLADPQVGTATVTRALSLPSLRGRRAVADIDVVLDWVVLAGGTGFLRNEPALRLLLDPANLAALQGRVLAIVESEDMLSDELRTHVPPDVSLPEALAMLMTLLHVRRIALSLELLDRLLERLIDVVALDTAMTSFRLRATSGAGDVRRQWIRELRSGRNALSGVVRELTQATRPFGWTHQLFIERQLDRLTRIRAEWQLHALVAPTAASPPPTPSDIANYTRSEDIDGQLATLEVDRRLLNARLRAIAGRLGEEDVDRHERAVLRAEREELRRLLRERQAQIPHLRMERMELRRDLGGPQRLVAIASFLEAERRGMHRVDAARDRDRCLGDADRRLAYIVEQRLAEGSEADRWTRYRLLLDRLLRNQLNVGVELMMDSFLKVAQYTERRRDIGVDGHEQGLVQWLTYPGHGDNAVDLNCQAGRPVVVRLPDLLAVPQRLRSEPADEVTYRHVASHATDRVRTTTDLQDMFGKIAGALVPSQRGRGVSSDELAHVYSRHEGRDLAPHAIVARRFTDRDITSILIGLLATNLAAGSDDAAFDALRGDIVDDLEAAVVRFRSLPSGTRLFRRGVSGAAGRGTLGRFIEIPSERDLVASVRAVLTPTSSLPYREERGQLLHRIWRLTLLMRSAGAEAHRAAGSVTVRHQYRASGGVELAVEVYYTHLHSAAIRPGAVLRQGARIGLTGMTGNAVNPHVHMEIRLLRVGKDVGTLLPHEFFPLRDALPGRTGA